MESTALNMYAFVLLIWPKKNLPGVYRVNGFPAKLDLATLYSDPSEDLPQRRLISILTFELFANEKKEWVYQRAYMGAIQHPHRLSCLTCELTTTRITATNGLPTIHVAAGHTYSPRTLISSNYCTTTNPSSFKVFQGRARAEEEHIRLLSGGQSSAVLQEKKVVRSNSTPPRRDLIVLVNYRIDLAHEPHGEP
jgi:hypothetical protein